MPLSPQQAVVLTRRYQEALQKIGERSVPPVREAWDALTSYDEDQIPKFARKVAPTLNAAKAASVRQASGYYALLANIRPAAITADDILYDADMREPFISVWSALKNGASYEEAVAAGGNRTDAVVRNLVTSSSRQTGDVFAERANTDVEAWERVADARPCDWCRERAGNIHDTAADADYGHDRCGCSAMPIFTDTEDAGPLRHGTAKEGTDWAKEHWGDGTDLPENERESLRNYGGGAYKGLNTQLRNERFRDATAQTEVANIDKALARTKTPEPVVVHRATDAESFPAELLTDPDSLVGKQFVERGFMSTSVGNAIPSAFSKKQVHIEIEVPKGTPARYMTPLNAARFKAERELLLGRNQKYEIVSVSRRGFRITMKMRIVPGAKR